MCIVGVGKIAPVNSLKPFLTIRESASALTICMNITGLAMPAHVKKALCECSESPLVKCLFVGLKPIIHHILDFLFTFISLQQKLEVTNCDF